MKRRIIRQWLKWTIPVNLLLLALVFIDYFAWESAAMAVVLIFYSLYLVLLIVLLLLTDRAPYTRVTGAKEPRRILVFRRQHGPS